LIRFIEHVQSFQKCYNLKYRQRLLETGHPLWTIDNNMKILDATKKGYHMTSYREAYTSQGNEEKYNQLNANIVSSLMLSLAFYRRKKKTRLQLA